MSNPLIAIVGAPNVGKSTLFNRLVGRRQSIVTDQPGVTRDRIYGQVDAHPIPFEIVDTGGLTPHTDAPFAREIESQADAALERAAVIVYVIDCRAGLTALDHELAPLLRRRGKPLLLVANKADSPKLDAQAQELSSLGLGAPHPISAEHGRGVDDLVDRIVEELQRLGVEPPPPARAIEDADETEESAASTEAQDHEIRVAIVGRPNVGKSSILNRLVGEQRAVVSDIPGTTRDAVDTLLEVEGQHFRLIDTAGIRRRGKVQEAVERFSVVRARDNIERCDVALLVLDATQALAAQDAHIGGYVFDAHKPVVVVVNKWDALEGREEAAKRWEETVRHRLRFLKQVPILYTSALTGQRVEKILDRVVEQFELAGRRLSTAQLNDWIGRLQGVAGSSATSGRGFRIFYVTQTGTHPLRFRIFCNDPKRLHFSLQRHLENSLRDRFDLGAAPIRLDFRSRSGEKAG